MANFDELRELLDGDVLCDELSRAMYSSGACLYRVRPLAIVRPRHKLDVVKVVEYAAQKGIPITARGGGTSRTGNELGEGIVLDFSKYMNQILEFDCEKKWIRVQPGLILAHLNRFLKPYGLFFPPDPSSGDCCTLGGMIANNSNGPRAVKYGTTRDHVLSLEVILSDGETIQTGPVPLLCKELAKMKDAETREGELYRKILEIFNRYRDPLRDEKPIVTKDSSGYHLWSFQKEGFCDMTSLLVGSEGTLGIVSEANLNLMPLPINALSGLLYFKDFSKVGEATQKILELTPSMVEILDRHILDLARVQKVAMRPFLPDGIEALLIIEFQGDDPAKLRQSFTQVEKRIVREARLAVDLKVAGNESDMDMFTKVRSVAGPILNTIRGPMKPVAFIEDAAVHPSHLPQYVKDLKELFTAYDLRVGIYGHAGDGNLHTMVFLNLNQPDQVAKMVSLAEDVYDRVLDLKGTISAEHGDGRTRTYYLKKQYPELYPAFEEIKSLFDPRNILNPGVIVGAEANPLNQHLKYGKDYHIASTGSMLDGEYFRTEVESCSGCGKCRSYCPVARKVDEEWATGRGKITLLREILSGHLDAGILQTPQFKKVVDSCINCKRCIQECPSRVDVPWLAVIGRANYLKKHAEPLGNRLLANTRLLCTTGNALAPLANWANTLAPARRLMEKAVGLDRRRYLPPFQRPNLRKILQAQKPSDGNRQVVMFPSCFSNFNNPEEDGLATLRVLNQNGITALLPDLHCCRFARINSGAIDAAMEDIQFNVRVLADYVDQGLDIVFSEPSCALAVKMEYPKILNTDATRRVADKCYDIHQYLMKLHRKGELKLDLGELRLTVGYHHPCHLRALGAATDVVELLELIPGLRIRQYSDQCCGLGGTFGMKKDNFDLSMQIGSALFCEIKDSGVDEIATSCSACAMQIYQGTQKEGVHPVALLAKAYQKINGG